MQNVCLGYDSGTNKLKDVFEWSIGRGVKVLTFYAMSIENMDKRPKRELNFLFRIARRELMDVIDNNKNFTHAKKVKLRFFGRLHLLPHDMQDIMSKAAAATKEYSKYSINFAIAYGGRQEIVDACISAAMKVRMGMMEPSGITEDFFKNSLCTNGLPMPDLIIRTGGEKRLSNFLLFQSAYSELAFTDTFWPDITKKEFSSIIDDYEKRDRRFGK
jgi:tritrans,polycis-undecaprenyl-diphosphate synthase [geranylgeranyl-diphosphate specific]